MSPEASALPLRHALALGALHGPAELLPVSSSAHVALVPQLLGWPYADLPPDVRKAFEVALHTGTFAGLVALLPAPRPASRCWPPCPPR
jgi:undecaprenyl-diphosphatase